MNPLASKIYLDLGIPEPNDGLCDIDRIHLALGMDNVRFTLNALRTLQPAAYKNQYKITITLAEGNCSKDLIQVEGGNTTDSLYGLALDIGSTTIDLALVDLNSGLTLQKLSCVNSQFLYGKDILTRIIATRESRDNLEKMRKAVISDIESLIDKLLISRYNISALTVGGNTTMIHLFAGCDPWQIFQTPYSPVFFDPGILTAKELGLNLICNVYFMSAVANYLGGDITGGLMLTNILESDTPVLFFDIGTNGELALGCKDYLLVGAGAAGPALEGDVSISGMRAEPGAVSKIRIKNNKLKYHTIDNLPPKGICGSGILELISEGFLSGWISGNGKIVDGPSEYVGEIISPISGKPVSAIFYTGDKNSDFFFTDEDIHSYISCKAAAFTMVSTMLDTVGMSINDISKFYFAGGFGMHYDLESAITVGIYPDIPREKFVILGNTSLKGAISLLLNSDRLNDLKQICQRATYIQFSEQEKFLENMIAAKFLPHTNQNLFPTVMKEYENRRNLN